MSKPLPLLKYAAWSPSKASLAGNCPLAFKYRYIDKVPTGPKNKYARIGVLVHRVQELVLMGESLDAAYDKAFEETEDAFTHKEIEEARSFAHNVKDFLNRINKFKESNPVKDTQLESKWAITADFKSCDFKDADSALRGVVDLAFVMKNGYVIIIDHKTGRMRPIEYYKTQLNFYTVMALSRFPDLKGVQCALHYVAPGKLIWSEPAKPKFIRDVLQPWLIGYLNKKAERADTQTAAPGNQCKWCDYGNICPARGSNGEAGEGDSKAS